MEYFSVCFLVKLVMKLVLMVVVEVVVMVVVVLVVLGKKRTMTTMTTKKYQETHS